MLVYLLLNKVNGKCYIGQHNGYNISERWNEHIRNVKDNAHLTNAILKYGAKSFSRQVLCYASCQQELDLLERFFIAIYKSTDKRFGYNRQSGGRKWCGRYTKELRTLIGESTHRALAKRSDKERWEFAFAAKIRWLMRSERERKRITAPMTRGKREYRWPWNKGKKGIPSGRKGKKYGPQQNPCRSKKPCTAEHKERISKALRRYHRQRRRENEA
jgi:group I intron endonuclease